VDATITPLCAKARDSVPELKVGQAENAVAFWLVLDILSDEDEVAKAEFPVVCNVKH
jgi:hypothetical protein